MERIYRYPNPGFLLPLNLDGKAIKTKGGKSCALFRDTGNGPDRCGIFRTSDEEVGKAIEQSNAFVKGVIIRLKSDDEIRFETLKAERAKFREQMVEMAKEGLLNVEVLDKKKATELQEFAKKIGVETTTDKGNRKKEEILAEVKEILFPVKEDENQ